MAGPGSLRIFHITPDGIAGVRAIRRKLDRLWAVLPERADVRGSAALTSPDLRQETA